MNKTLLQTGLMTLIVLSATAIEAALPLVLTSWLSKDDVSLSSSQDRGTLQAWGKCLVGSWKSNEAQNAQDAHTRCNLNIATFQPGTVSIDNVEISPEGICGTDKMRLQRGVHGNITNITSNIYLSQAMWRTEYKAFGKTLKSTGGGNIWLAPNESRKSCLHTFTFDKENEAVTFEQNFNALQINGYLERGVATYTQ